jgi:multicomponent Na+:H+ antiporter subunit G
MTETLREIALVLTLVGGAAFTGLAGIGVWRMPDFLNRMHAASKASTLGLLLLCAAAALAFGWSAATLDCALAALFLLLTSPVSGHLLGRAALRAGTPYVDHEGRPARGYPPEAGSIDWPGRRGNPARPAAE